MAQYRTIWISDVHLGTTGCQANYLLDFFETIHDVTDQDFEEQKKRFRAKKK
jgi:hypothetical protein